MEQFDTCYDFPEQSIVKRNYIISYTPRSGSHLIGHYLGKTGQMGFPLEYLNPNNFPVWQQRFQTNDIVNTFEMIKRYRTSSNGCFGCKLGLKEFERIVSENKFDDVFSDAKIVRIRRKDILSQAVSLAKAKMTGSFISLQKPVAEAKYSHKLIDDALQEIIVDNARLDYIFNKRSFSYFQVYYEDFIENPGKILKDIALFVGIDLKINTPSGDLELPKKQSDGINREFKRLFIQENRMSKLDTDFEFLQDVDSVPIKMLVSQLLSRINRKLNFANKAKFSKS